MGRCKIEVACLQKSKHRVYFNVRFFGPRHFKTNILLLFLMAICAFIIYNQLLSTLTTSFAMMRAGIVKHWCSAPWIGKKRWP